MFVLLKPSRSITGCIQCVVLLEVFEDYLCSLLLKKYFEHCLSLTCLTSGSLVQPKTMLSRPQQIFGCMCDCFTSDP